MKKQTVRDLTHIAIVAALYVVLTVVPPFNLISYRSLSIFIMASL